MAITSFRNKYFFLSSMYPCKIDFGDITYPSVENAFQAAKTTKLDDKFIIAKLKPSESKYYGRNRIKMRNDWNDIKLDIMYQLVKIKFSDPVLKQLLIDTAGEDIIEDNNWGDTFWGVCGGIGQNQLGKILMKVRTELLNA